MHMLAVIMLHQNTFCVYKGKRKLKLLVHFALQQVLFCFANIFLENVEKRFAVGCFLEGVGRVKVNTTFFFFFFFFLLNDNLQY